MAWTTRTAGTYEISDDPARFDLARGHGWIARESYWAKDIPLDLFARACAGSLTIGAYAAGGRMDAMARVITDKATFGWLCDVFVDVGARGSGLGKALVAYVQAHPDLQGLRRLALATHDAHGLYAQFGFAPPARPGNLMEVRGTRPYGG